MQNKVIPAICYDLPTVSQFLRSVALAVAFQRYSKLEWVDYRDSSVLNAIYACRFWKAPPGNVEFRQPQEKIETLTNTLHKEYLKAWLKKLAHLQSEWVILECFSYGFEHTGQDFQAEILLIA